jgi:predicted nucleotidyltransferase
VNVLLSGIVGSTAYGLAHEGSDVDRLGVYAVDTVELHGLRKPEESKVTKDPDVTLHEAAKWCRLALSGNPTVMELVWLPEDLYEVRTQLGDQLIGIRSAFLSAKRVRDAYLGYATQQFRKLESRGDGTFGPDLAKRTAKHARHMYRLLAQGLELWVSGHLTIKIANPSDVLDFGEEVAAGDLRLAREVLASYEDAFNANPTVLPDTPDEAAAEAWLRRVRAEFYKGEK